MPSCETCSHYDDYEKPYCSCFMAREDVLKIRDLEKRATACTYFEDAYDKHVEGWFSNDEGQKNIDEETGREHGSEPERWSEGDDPDDIRKINW